MVRRAESTPLNMVIAVIVTCVVAASALTLTYMLTRDRIAAQERAAEERAIQAVLPRAAEFASLGESTVAEADAAAGDTPVTAIFEADDESGAAIGWAVRVSPRGYGGPMQLVVGVDRDGLVTGVSIITQNETPGLGTKILTEPGFLEQFSTWNATDIDASSKEFDAISGATKSSNGVRKGVIAAGHAFAAVLAESGGSE